MYADDLALTVYSKNQHIFLRKLSDISSTITEWCNANRLKLNHNKTVDLKITTKSGDFSLNTPVNFLGIYMESSLGWNTHIEYLANKLSKSLFIIRILKQYLNVQALLSVYYAHFYSHLSYGIILWGNHTSVSKLLVIQKRCVRMICGAQYREHCKPLFVRLGVLTLPSMYILDCLLYVKRNIQSFNYFSLVHSYNTRNNANIYLDKCKYSVTQRNYYYMSQRFFNSIPLNIRNLPVSSFKKAIQNKLLENPLYAVDEYFNIVW